MPGVAINPCESCDGRCCYHYVVPVTGYDAWVIASAQHLSMEHFLVYMTEKERTPTGFQLDRTGTTYTLVLNKQASRQKMKPCIFLLTIARGYGRCSIYPHRPLVCQTFPAVLYHGTVNIREDTVCPKGAWNVAAMDLPAWRASLLRMEMQSGIYRLVVSHWNECVQNAPFDVSYSILEYFAYLMSVYNRLETLRRDTPEEEMALIMRTWGRQAASTEKSQEPWHVFLIHVQDVLTKFANAPHNTQREPQGEHVNEYSDESPK